MGNANSVERKSIAGLFCCLLALLTQNVYKNYTVDMLHERMCSFSFILMVVHCSVI